MGTVAWNDLTGALLSERDRNKFERAIGAVLIGGRLNPVVLQGSSRSGKTTLLNIARNIFAVKFEGLRESPVAFELNEVSKTDRRKGLYQFVESNLSWENYPDDVVAINTIGGDIPLDRYSTLLDKIDTELNDIADACVKQYQN